ncbi:MAG: anthranilate synthase component I family protein [Nannocystaceae bacterium]|nr:anthranilate synthase component I family protein [Nannocystaceae bacterium]
MRIHPDPATFRRLAARAPVVPVWCEQLADGASPLSVFATARQLDPRACLLESVQGGERWARYSFVTVGARASLTGTLEPGGLIVRAQASPAAAGLGPSEGEAIATVRAWLSALRMEPHDALPPLPGGIVGVWGHDFVRALERLPRPATQRPSRLPVLDLVATDIVLAFDALAQRMFVIAAAIPGCDGGVEAAREHAAARIGRVITALRERAVPLPPAALPEVPEPTAAVEPPWSRAQHLDAVARAQQHIVRGDVFQVVLSQVFTTPQDGLDPLDVYRVLRATNPAPYMFALQSPAATLVGASPEVLVRVDRDRRMTLRPIAGTRPRGRDPEHDAALAAELAADPKERAEHVMLIDLGRNDVGRVAQGGSVRVVESFALERYSRVMHLVSEVCGTLRPEHDALDALVAAFPAGTLSGAPKLRALELIDAIEPVSRGWYGGAVGYLGYDGTADFAIAIRSVVADGEQLRVQAGSGIVFDSVPQAEDAECHAKAAAALRAIAMARQIRQEGAWP